MLIIDPFNWLAREHLLLSDTALVKLRRIMLTAVKAMQQGEPPPSIKPARWRVRTCTFSIPSAQSFAETVDEHIRVDGEAMAEPGSR